MTNEERRPTGLLHTADELRQLIRNNPTLPLLVFAGEEANSGDYSLGYTEHDEKKVDELANVLHMMILDNPAVFAPVKEGQHENG